MNSHENIIERIGNTPIVKLNKIPGDDDADIWAKLEGFNPGGSVKDRIALSMIETAEREKKLKPGGTIIEPTSGNTGIGLAFIAAVKGYKLILTMPETMSLERRQMFQAFGAELVLTPGTKGMLGSVEEAEIILKKNPDYFMPMQFENPANPKFTEKPLLLRLLNHLGQKLMVLLQGSEQAELSQE